MKKQLESTMLRIGPAAKYIGVHPLTLRHWANDKKIPVFWLGRERRFNQSDLDLLAGKNIPVAVRQAVGYTRVSGGTGQETSLVAQEEEIRQVSGDHFVRAYKDKASGLKEHRPGLDKLLHDAKDGQFNVVVVTHQDRLARFGASWIIHILHLYGVEVEILHDKRSVGGMEELLEDFMSLVATFAGRMYGIRGKEAKTRVLRQALSRVEGEEN